MSALQLPMSVTLKPGHRRVAMWNGRTRQAQNDRAGVRDQRADIRQRSEAIHIHGCAAEMAFAIAANLMPDLDPHVQSGSVDCVLPSGLTVDVKCRTGKRGRLIESLTSKSTADLYVLVVGRLPMTDAGDHDWSKPCVMRIDGWAWRHEVRANVAQSMPRPCYVLDNSKLRRVLPLVSMPEGNGASNATD